MPELQKKNILLIFDCFGVLFGEVNVKFFRKHYPAETYETIMNGYFNGADAGRGTLRGILQEVADDLHMDVEDIMKERFGYAVRNEELFALLFKLREHCYTALLSNAVRGVFEKDSLDAWPYFDKAFDKKFVSYEHGIIKPNLKFYEICRDSFGREFDAIYFFDDNMANLTVLEGTNIQGVLYRNIDDVKAIVEKHHILEE